MSDKDKDETTATTHDTTNDTTLNSTEDGNDTSSPGNRRGGRQRKRTKDRGLDGGYWASLNTSTTSTTTPTPSDTSTRNKRRRTAVERLYVDDLAPSPQIGDSRRSRSTSVSERAPSIKSNASAKVLYKKGAFLAVRNESDGFYLCLSLANIMANSSRCKIQWLEEERAGSNAYTLAYMDFVDQQTIITQVSTKKVDKGAKSTYAIDEDDLKKINELLEKAIKEGGIEIEMSESGESSSEESEAEKDAEESKEGSTTDTEPVEGKASRKSPKSAEKPPKKEVKVKEKKKRAIVADPYLFDEDNSSRDKDDESKKDKEEPKKDKDENAPKAVAKAMPNNTKSHLDSVRNKVLQKLQQASPSQQPFKSTKTLNTAVKPTRKVVIEDTESSHSSDNETEAPAAKKGKKETTITPPPKKTSPKKPPQPKEPKEAQPTPKPLTKRQMFKVISNRFLEERPAVTVPPKDPFFEDESAPTPFVSPQIHARLAFRYINTNDTEGLKALIADTARCPSLAATTRSHVTMQTPLEYAIMCENLDAIKILLDDYAHPKPNRTKSASSMLSKFTTGTYNACSLPTYRVHKVHQSRGVKEGNNALLKDIGHLAEISPDYWMSTCFQCGVSDEIIDLVSVGLEMNDRLCATVIDAILYGHRKLAARIIEAHGAQFGFNSLHSEVMKLDYEELKPNSVRAASCRKKAFDYYSKNDQVTPIHCAAINPNVKYLKSLLNITQDYSISDKAGRKPIHYAAVCEGPMPLEYLLTKVSANETDAKGLTPLHYACLAGRTLNVEILLRSADEKLDDEQVQSDMMTVANKYGVGGINRPARSAQVSPGKTLYSVTPLHLAISRNHVDCVKVLIKYGANVEYQMGAEKVTPLMWAAQLGHHKIVQLLREVGSARVEARDRYQRTALMHAASVGNTRSLAFLLKLGANPMAFDSSGNTALHYACAYGWLSCVDELTAVGGTGLVNVANEWKMSAFGAAFLKGHVGVCDRLIEKFPGAVDVNFRTETGETLVMLCAASVAAEDNLEQLKYIVGKLKANCKLVDAKGNTALHHLATNLSGDVEKKEKILAEMARVVIGAGCEVDVENNAAETALHCAVRLGNVDFAEFLLNECKVKLKLGRSGDGDTLMHLVAAADLNKEAYELIEVLIDRDVDACRAMVCVQNEKKRQPLDRAFEALNSFLAAYSKETVPRGFIDMVLKMVDVLGADVNRSVLSLVDDRCVELVRELLSGDAQLDLALYDESGASWLHRTVMRNQVDLARFLVEKMPVEVIKARNKVEKESFGDTCVHLAVRLGFFGMYDALIDECKRRMRADELVSLLGGVSETGENLMHVLAGVAMPKRIDFGVKRLDGLGEIVGREMMRAMVRECDKVHARTPLHVALLTRPAFSSDDTNNVDLELYLIENCAADLQSADARSRLPIHYLFCNLFVDDVNDGVDVTKAVETVDPVELLTVITGRMEKGVDLMDAFGYSPLHYAVLRGATISACHLMGLGARVGADGTNSPLSSAIFHTKETLSLELLKSQPKPSLNAWYYANASSKDTEESEYRWRAKSAFNRPKTVSKSALFELIVRNRWQGIAWFVLSDLGAYSLRRIDAIVGAIRAGNYNLALRFIDSFERLVGKEALFGELARDRLDESQTLLHVIATQSPSDGTRKIVARLVGALCADNAAFIEATDAHGAAAVHYACVALNFDFIDALVPFKRDLLKLKDRSGNSAFSLFFYNIGSASYGDETVLGRIKGYYEAGEMLYACYPCLDAANFNVDPDKAVVSYPHVAAGTKSVHALLFAVNRQDANVVKFLVKALGVDVNATDSDGLSALMYAIRVNSIAMVKLLLDIDYEKNKAAVEKPAIVRQTSKTNGRIRGLGKTLFGDKEPKIDENEEMEVDDDQSSDEEVDENEEEDENGEETVEVDANSDENDDDFTKFELKSRLDLTHMDNESRTIFHHMALALDYGSFVNARMARLVLECRKAAPIEHSFVKAFDSKAMSALDYASKHGNVALIGELNRYVGTPQRSLKLAPFHVADPHYAGPYAIPDYNADAEALIKATATTQQTDEWSPKVDPLSRMAETGDLALDEASKVPYDVLLTKTDISYGFFGLHNFYKMQIIVSRETSEGLFLLFTRWGRIGDQGQYQRTPFSSLTEAVVEFSKIFKAKTGNDYGEVVVKKSKAFEAKIKKYALVSLETRRKNPLADIEFDLVGMLEKGVDVPEVKLRGDEWMRLFAPLIDAQWLKAKSGEATHLATAYVPLTRLAKRSLLDAQAILLNELKPMIERKIEVERQRKKENLQEYLKLIESINAKSNEYYQLVPQSGYEFEKLEPVSNEKKLEAQLSVVQQLIDYQLTIRVLMGAFYSAKTIHPIDYIYQALNCKMCRLGSLDADAQFIMRYVNVSAPKVSVKAIFKVERMGEQERFDQARLPSGEAKMLNRYLLWHGTRTENVLSILCKGLIKAPIGSAHNGCRFGRGIYLTDVFSMANGYASLSHNRAKARDKFMFLCETALGKVQEVVPYVSFDKLAEDCDSLKCVTKLEPNKQHDVAMPNGCKVPLGELVPCVGKKQVYSHEQFSQFVVYDEAQVCIRYLVQYSD